MPSRLAPLTQRGRHHQPRYRPVRKRIVGMECVGLIRQGTHPNLNLTSSVSCIVFRPCLNLTQVTKYSDMDTRQKVVAENGQNQVSSLLSSLPSSKLTKTATDRC